MIADFCADELRWRPIELRTIADVEKLNALLAAGWRLESIDLEGLPFLAFCGREGEASYAAKRTPTSSPSTARLLLILQKGAPGARTQRAVYVERQASGYIEMERKSAKSLRMLGVFPIGNDATVTIYEDRASTAGST